MCRISSRTGTGAPRPKIKTLPAIGISQKRFLSCQPGEIRRSQHTDMIVYTSPLSVGESVFNSVPIHSSRYTHQNLPSAPKSSPRLASIDAYDDLINSQTRACKMFSLIVHLLVLCISDLYNILLIQLDCVYFICSPWPTESGVTRMNWSRAANTRCSRPTLVLEYVSPCTSYYTPVKYSPIRLFQCPKHGILANIL